MTGALAVGGDAEVDGVVVGLDVLHLEGVPLLARPQVLVVRRLLVEVELVVVVDLRSAVVHHPLPPHAGGRVPWGGHGARKRVNHALNTFYLQLYGVRHKEILNLTMHSTEGNVLFNNALNTFYLTVIWCQTYGKGRKEMFCLTTHSTHFI